MGVALLKKLIPHLKALKQANAKRRKDILKTANDQFVNCVAECCLNVLNGNVKITKPQKKKLSRYAKTLRTLAKRGIPVKQRRTLLIQKGGFLPALLAPILTLVAHLV